ncbi:unnamed protein product [Prunus armeniaca]|uniref:Uncharacterized protein n=1 Tax=Prunus armeniaca TaxID=36596 RepID=A0A6J5TH91_PRUAR|nr:unnamed protein product [Prunus armeniaca]
MFSASREPSRKHGYTNSFQGGFGDDEEALKMSTTNKKRREMSMSCEVFNGGMVSSYPPVNPMFKGSTSGVPKKKDSGGGGEALRNKDLHMFVWNSSLSPNSDGNLRHAVNRVASTDFGVIDPSKAAVLQQHETAASKGMHDLIANMSPGRKTSAYRELELEEGSKFPASASLYGSFWKKVDMEDGDVAKNLQMPRASVMIRLILIMICKKLIRNPNTYARVLGLAWSLISYKIIHGFTTKDHSLWKSVATFAMAVRFLTGPTMIAGTSIAIGLRGILLHVSILQAALPQGIVPFVFAKEYNVHADILSTARARNNYRDLLGSEVTRSEKSILASMIATYSGVKLCPFCPTGLLELVVEDSRVDVRHVRWR